MFFALYRLIAFCVWFGVMFAAATVIIALAAIAVLAVTAYGLIAPNRTVRSALHSLALNVGAAVDHVQALR